MVSRNASFHEQGFLGLLLTPVKAVLGGVLLLAVLLLAAWTMDWVMVTWVWPDGIGQLKWMLARDLARAIDLADRQSGRPELVSGTVNLLYGMIFKLTGIHGVGMRFAENAALSIPVCTAVSEKLYAIALLGMTNTRLMVYLYIGVLLNREALNANTLVGAIAATFARRGRCGNDVPLAMWTTDFCRAIFANR